MDLRKYFKSPSAKEHHYCCSFIPQSIIENLEQAEFIDDETRESLQATIDAGNKEAVKEREDVGDEDKNPHEPDLPPDPEDEKYPRPGPRKQRYDFHSSDQPAPIYLYDAKNDPFVDRLPGTLVRQSGQAPVADKAVNACYDSLEKAETFFREVYGWKSYDDKNSKIVATVHYGKEFVNAFFFPAVRQLVFGDGNNWFFNFNKSYEVVGHEFTHAIIGFSSGLIYSNESGALNESCSDVMSTLLEQWSKNLTADKADWLLGQDVLFPWDPQVAMRSFKAPGKAYNGTKGIGNDYSVGHMKYYIKTDKDNGAVHWNSGIPNHAFYLAATRFGGYAWEVPGKTWFKAMTTCKSSETFAGFARRTIAEAATFNELHPTWIGILTQAWRDVGVLPAEATWYDWFWSLTHCGGRIVL